MAVVDKYSDDLIEAGKLQKSALVVGDAERVLIAKVSVVAGDDDGSVYRIAKGLDSSVIITGVEIYNSAITAGTDYDLGFYQAEAGAVADKDILVDGVDLSSAHASGSPVNGLSAVAYSDFQKTIAQLLGLTDATRKMRYDIALTANTVGTADGTIVVRIRYVQG